MFIKIGNDSVEINSFNLTADEQEYLKEEITRGRTDWILGVIPVFREEHVGDRETGIPLRRIPGKLSFDLTGCKESKEYFYSWFTRVMDHKTWVGCKQTVEIDGTKFFGCFPVNIGRIVNVVDMSYDSKEPKPVPVKTLEEAWLS